MGCLTPYNVTWCDITLLWGGKGVSLLSYCESFDKFWYSILFGGMPLTLIETLTYLCTATDSTSNRFSSHETFVLDSVYLYQGVVAVENSKYWQAMALNIGSSSSSTIWNCTGQLRIQIINLGIGFFPVVCFPGLMVCFWVLISWQECWFSLLSFIKLAPSLSRTISRLDWSQEHF